MCFSLCTFSSHPFLVLVFRLAYSFTEAFTFFYLNLFNGSFPPFFSLSLLSVPLSYSLSYLGCIFTSFAHFATSAVELHSFHGPLETVCAYHFIFTSEEARTGENLRVFLFVCFASPWLAVRV